MAEPIAFRGDTFQCLGDLLNKEVAPRALVAEFCRVELETVARWEQGVKVRDVHPDMAQFPKGETLLRLRCFLDWLGYKVSDHLNLPLPTQRLNQLIAFDVLTADQTRAELGYTRLKSLFDVLLRGNSLQADRVFKLSQMTSDFHPYAEQLRGKMAEWKARLEGETPESLVQSETSLSPEKEEDELPAHQPDECAASRAPAEPEQSAKALGLAIQMLTALLTAELQMVDVATLRQKLSEVITPGEVEQLIEKLYELVASAQ